MIRIVNILVGVTAIIIWSGKQGIANSQPADSIRLESAVFIEVGAVATRATDKIYGIFGNSIIGFGYQREIAGFQIGTQVVSALITGGFGYKYLDIQAGMQIDVLSNLYIYTGVQFMMYLELGNSRNKSYDQWGKPRQWPDRILTQILPNFGIGYNASNYRIEVLSSVFTLEDHEMWFYYIFRFRIKI